MKNLKIVHLKIDSIFEPVFQAIRLNTWTDCFGNVTSCTLEIPIPSLWRFGMRTLYLPRLVALHLVCPKSTRLLHVGISAPASRDLKEHLAPFINKHAGLLRHLKIDCRDSTWEQLIGLFSSLSLSPSLISFGLLGRMHWSNWYALHRTYLEKHESTLEELTLISEVDAPLHAAPRFYISQRLTCLNLMLKFSMTAEFTAWLKLKLPQLRVLCIPEAAMEQETLEQFVVGKATPCHSLEELTLRSIISPIKLLPILANLCPELRVFRLYYGVFTNEEENKLKGELAYVSIHLLNGSKLRLTVSPSSPSIRLSSKLPYRT
jgi:hypothetical protein